MLDFDERVADNLALVDPKQFGPNESYFGIWKVGTGLVLNEKREGSTANVAYNSFTLHDMTPQPLVFPTTAVLTFSVLQNGNVSSVKGYYM